MIYTAQNAKNKMLVDGIGRQIKFVKTWDDVTNEAEIPLMSGSTQDKPHFVVSGGDIVTVKVHLPDAKLIDKV